jgi:hypothetical protein
MPHDLLFLLHVLCWSHRVEPAFAQAVAHVESSDRHHEFRYGPMGKGTYAGPMGLHRAYCREKFGVDPVAPEVNIAIGVRALRGRDKVQVLRRYNTEYNRAYERSVMKAYRKYQKEEKAT